MRFLLAALVLFAMQSPRPGPPDPRSLSPDPDKFDSSRAWAHLERQVALGPRPAGSAAIAECRRYIVAQLKAAGLTAREQARCRTPTAQSGCQPDRYPSGAPDPPRAGEHRHQAVKDSASSGPATARRRGRPARAAARARLRPNCSRSSCFLRRRKPWSVRGDDRIYGSRHYVRRAQAGPLGG